MSPPPARRQQLVFGHGLQQQPLPAKTPPRSAVISVHRLCQAAAPLHAAFWAGQPHSRRAQGAPRPLHPGLQARSQVAPAHPAARNQPERT